MSKLKIAKTAIFLLFIMLVLSSCQRLLGYGVLLWSTDDPAVPSGTVLPVHIRSNINSVWVVGIPRELRTPDNRNDKFEIPLPQLELSGSRRRAEARAEEFAPYALIYAETLQDGLPIRATPDNSARRVYRLRLGEVIKVLAPANRGIAAIGTTGDPLPGEWYRVLTSDGVVGYCFSYRLRLFEHEQGPLMVVMHEQQPLDDPILDRVLERTWSPEHYGTMVSRRRIDLDELSRQWHFDPGAETGVARIRLEDLQRDFPYTMIQSIGAQSWRFEGSSLQMHLRAENSLAVQYTESSGHLSSINFIALPQRVDDIILQETVRREGLVRNAWEYGPEFTSSSHGTLTLLENGRFTWNDYSLLIPNVIPASAIGSGNLDMGLYVSPGIAEIYSGALTLRFDTVGGAQIPVNFLYAFDTRGLMIEMAPPTSMDGVTVVRRASNPVIIYFFRSGRPDISSPFDSFRFDDDLFIDIDEDEEDDLP
ncbi:MAG: SH3 domain-containing protein [Treponema sp.]|nr:SH3 domain-containing protein [Treponema sp.]